jgi:3-deoxy-D-manno-octulosonic-acid transferase
MPRTSLWYRLSLWLARRLVPLGAIASPKLDEGHRGRTGAPRRLQQWAAASRDPARPLVWVHAPSVGEGLQAAAVIRRLRGLHPDWQYAYTYFSPSARQLGDDLPVDISDYVPYDTVAETSAVVDALQPTALVFAKLDLWPQLACRAAASGAAVMLAAATVRPGSGRMRWPVRSLLRPGYRVVSAAGAIAAEDGERLVRLGVAPEAVTVTGDPRFDSVWHRVQSTRPDDPLLRVGGGAATLVAGSTWPQDDAVLLGAFARVREKIPDSRLIIAPHEPTRSHLAALGREAARLGLPEPTILSDDGEPTRFMVIDRVGLLADLYGAGRMAYVGGAMGHKGIHSVLEPAAWGVPVVFGPHWHHSREAGLLLEAGGATALAAPAIEHLGRLWIEWLQNDETRQRQGERARRVVENGLGAASRTAALIESALLDHSAFDRYRPGG